MSTKTKIICTIGPATSDLNTMIAMIEAGMSVARLNFSHGSLETHQHNIELLKQARKKTERPVAIMLDTQGPEIRVGKIKNDAKELSAGQFLRLQAQGDGEQTITVDPPEVLSCLSVGTKVLFDDGYITAQVSEVGLDYAIVQILNKGVLKTSKKMNIPGVHLPIPALTPRDINDLKFGCTHDVDYVAASFIRSSHHVLTIKEILAKEGKPHIQVIAKIESTEGVENFDSIIQVADGIMIARGDLGVEIDLAKVPRLQKMMIRKCFQACKPSITATQMLESMISNPRPTRAEASDVANAIYDSTSCIMLSGETAVGRYPVETISRMQSIAKEAENDFNYHQFFDEHSRRDYHDTPSAIALAAVKTAYGANAKAIFAFTASGSTARFISRLRPSMPIIAVTFSEAVYQQLALNWGVIPILLKKCSNVKEALSEASALAMDQGIISFGDLVIVTAGVPFGKKGSTNMMTIESIGAVLVRGHKGFGAKVSGKVSMVLSPEGRDPQEFQGRIVVLLHCDNAFLPLLKHASGVILQNHLGDVSSEKYAALVAKTLEISVISRADGAMSLLQEGEEVTLDPQRGLVYRK